MDGAELGRRLRAARTAAARTIASVAADAGLSVPYIANLENGRGNPTLTTLHRLAGALNLRLDVALAPGGDEAADPAVESAEPSAALRQFGRAARFGAVAARLADRPGAPDIVGRQRLLTALGAAEAVLGRPLAARDLDRLLDALVLADLDAGA